MIWVEGVRVLRGISVLEHTSWEARTAGKCYWSTTKGLHNYNSHLDQTAAAAKEALNHLFQAHCFTGVELSNTPERCGGKNALHDTNWTQT